MSVGLSVFEERYLASNAPRFLGLLKNLESAENEQKDPAKKAEIHSLRVALDNLNQNATFDEKKEKVRKFESALMDNPDMEKKLKDLSTTNPQLVKGILPELDKNPRNIRQIIASVQSPQAEVADAQPQGRLDTVVTADAQDRPAPPAAAPVKAPAAALAAAPSTDISPDMRAKLEFLMENGGVDLMEQIGKSSPESEAKIEQMISGKGPDGEPLNVGKRDALINGLYDRTKANPNYLRDLSGAMKSFPGMTGSSLSLLASNPEQGLKMADMGLQIKTFLSGIMDFLKNPSMESFMTAMESMIGGAKAEVAQSRQLVADGDTALARVVTDASTAPGHEPLPVIDLVTGKPVDAKPQDQRPSQPSVSVAQQGTSFVDRLNLNPDLIPSG